MLFATESGSLYELDAKARRIRRLDGVDSPAPRLGRDGEWREFENISTPEVGTHVVITWHVDHRPPDYPEEELVGRATMTSRVVSLQESVEVN